VLHALLLVIKFHAAAAAVTGMMMLLVDV